MSAAPVPRARRNGPADRWTAGRREVTGFAPPCRRLRPAPKHGESCIACGVGSRLARLLTAAGDRVDGLYRRPDQGDRLAAEGINATLGDLTRLDARSLIFAAGAGGEGGADATTAIDGAGLTTVIEAARLAGVRRLLLVSVFPEAWRDREVSDTFEHYINVKKKADAELAATDLDWVILHPAALTDDAGTGRISLAPALTHIRIARDDVAATLAEIPHTTTIRREILELPQGPEPISDAVRRRTRN